VSFTGKAHLIAASCMIVKASPAAAHVWMQLDALERAP
jgi:hypothetical protein